MLTPTQRHRHLTETITRLLHTTQLLTPATTALRDAQPGYPTNTASNTTRTSGPPTGLDRYITTTDPAAHDNRQLDTHLTSLLNHATQLHQLLTRWGTPITDQPTIQRHASGGDCHACAKYCSGADGDRLRAGLCNACRMHWRRWSTDHPTHDRGDWLLQRRRQLHTDIDDNVA